jgi:hypothetical protein
MRTSVIPSGEALFVDKYWRPLAGEEQTEASRDHIFRLPTNEARFGHAATEFGGFHYR